MISGGWRKLGGGSEAVLQEQKLEGLPPGKKSERPSPGKKWEPPPGKKIVERPSWGKKIWTGYHREKTGLLNSLAYLPD